MTARLCATLTFPHGYGFTASRRNNACGKWLPRACVFFLVYAFSFSFSFATPASVKTLSYTVLDSKAHDPSLFTQGLLVSDGRIYESSGLYGKSRVVSYDVHSAVPMQSTLLPRAFFAEGLAKVKESLYLLTWRAGVAFKLDAMSLQILQQFTYSGQGWGLTYDGQFLVRSDGTNILHFHDPASFAAGKKISVTLDGTPLLWLNELEYAQGSIWANVWKQPFIVKIDPANGKVLALLDLSELAKKNKQTSESVLNGIAYDEKRDAFWITGKLWSSRYLIKLDGV